MWKDDEEYRQMLTRLGPRLAGLRRRAGLTQEELARRMGMSSPNKRMMVRIENGRTGNPGLASVARYLRACRAGFVDVLDLLDGYTRQAPIPEARAARAIAELEGRLAGQVRIRSGEELTTKTQRHKEDGPAKAGTVPQSARRAVQSPFSRGRTQKGGGWRL